MIEGTGATGLLIEGTGAETAGAATGSRFGGRMLRAALYVSYVPMPCTLAEDVAPTVVGPTGATERDRIVPATAVTECRT